MLQDVQYLSARLHSMQLNVPLAKITINKQYFFISTENDTVHNVVEREDVKNIENSMYKAKTGVRELRIDSSCYCYHFRNYFDSSCYCYRIW